MRSNPFNMGSLRPAHYMFGRALQAKAVERWAHDIESGYKPDPLCFLGSPGAGKTSLLKHAREVLRARNWLCGYSEASPDASSAIEDFLEDARRALPAGKISERFLSRLTEISVSAAGIGAGVKLGSSGQRTMYSRLFDFFATIGDVAKKSGAGVAILIDEAQVLPESDLRLLFRSIRNLDQYPVSIIVAGLPTLLMDIVESSSGRATGEKLRLFLVPELTPSESIQALSTPIRDAHGIIQDTQLNRMARFAEGHPLTLRMLGATAWELADDGIPDDLPLIIEESHVDTAIREVSRQLRLAYYEPTWQKSSAAERKCLASLAANGVPEGYDWLSAPEDRAWFLETPDLFPVMYRAMNDDILSSLVNRGIIRLNHPEEFTIPGFRQFVQHHRRLWPQRH